MLSRRNVIASAFWLALSGTALSGAALAQAPAQPLPVVATFSILGDLVREVGGERISLTTLVGPDGDAHVYSPSPADAKALAEAKLVVVNGLRFEGWIDRLVKASGTKAPVAVAAQGIRTIAAADDHGHGHSHGHSHGAADPHAWQDVGNAKAYIANIRDALAKADPAGAETYRANAAAYTAKLDALEADVKAAIASIPPARRRVITSHDAFGYFAKAYGVAFVAPQGVSTDTEASARDVAAIIRQIRKDKVPAVFLENVTDPRLVERIARETGAKMGGRLFSDALSPQDGPAGTYIAMVRHNIRTLTAALAD